MFTTERVWNVCNVFFKKRLLLCPNIPVIAVIYQEYANVWNKQVFKTAFL